MSELRFYNSGRTKQKKCIMLDIDENTFFVEVIDTNAMTLGKRMYVRANNSRQYVGLT